jgi:hypothetical protein
VQPISRVIPRALAELLRDTPTSAGKVEFVWKAVVGPAMDRGTAVRLEGTVLLVEARSAAWAREVARSSRVITKRMESLLGPGVIRELSVRV